MGRTRRTALLCAGLLGVITILIGTAVTLRRAHDIDRPDLFGEWVATYPAGEETFRLEPDGTCTQSVTFDSPGHDESGACTWDFTDDRWSPELKVHDCRVAAGLMKYDGEPEVNRGFCFFTLERELFFYLGPIHFGAESYPFEKTD